MGKEWIIFHTEDDDDRLVVEKEKFLREVHSSAAEADRLLAQAQEVVPGVPGVLQVAVESESLALKHALDTRCLIQGIAYLTQYLELRCANAQHQKLILDRFGGTLVRHGKHLKLVA